MADKNKMTLWVRGKPYDGNRQFDWENLKEAKILMEAGFGDFVWVPWNAIENEYLIVRRANHGHGPGIEVVFGSTDEICNL